MDNRPIGVFDSGLGGLTAVTELMRIMPNENIIYFADSARVPYGSRCVEELRRMAAEDLELVASYDTKAIIVACGTLSSNAEDIIKDFAVPSVGVIDPTVETAAMINADAPIGIIATSATVKNGAFEKKLAALCPEREIISIACPDFVPLIESGHCKADDAQLCNAVKKYLEPMKDIGVKALILGCTHYGLIADAIRAYLGDGVELISAAACAANKLREYIDANGISGGAGERLYITSGSVEEFTPLAGMLLGTDVRGKVIHRWTK